MRGFRIRKPPPLFGPLSRAPRRAYTETPPLPPRGIHPSAPRSAGEHGGASSLRRQYSQGSTGRESHKVHGFRIRKPPPLFGPLSRAPRRTYTETPPLPGASSREPHPSAPRSAGEHGGASSLRRQYSQGSTGRERVTRCAVFVYGNRRPSLTLSPALRAARIQKPLPSPGHPPASPTPQRREARASTAGPGGILAPTPILPREYGARESHKVRGFRIRKPRTL